MMAVSDSRALPAPEFGKKIENSAILRKANAWSNLLTEQSRVCGVKSQKRYHDFDDIGSAKRSKNASLGAYFCDTCDRGFKTDVLYQEHVEQHTTCHVKGCTYTAAPKLVKLHYEMQHKTGLANKIRESDVDIQKWIAERRRNFPTADNVQRKKQEEQERLERGEVLDTKQFGKMRGRGRGGRGGRGGGKTQYHNSNSSESHYKRNQSSRMSSTTYDPLAQFENFCYDDRPTSSYIQHDYTNSSPSKESTVALNTAASTSSVVPQPAALGGLTSLLSSYGDVSSSEEEEGEIKEDEEQAHQGSCSSVLESENHTNMTSTNIQSKDLLSPELKSPPILADEPIKNQEKLRRSLPPQSRSAHREYRKSHYITNNNKLRNRKSTLLENLLANEIRHERNVLLQCVRYVVNNNFFGVGGPQAKSNLSSLDDDVWN